MAFHQKGRASENLTGKGVVFKGKKFICGSAFTSLEVFENILVDSASVKQMVTGKIRAANKVE